MTNAEPDDGVFERGVAMRRRVHGDAHVDRSPADASEFARPVQDLVMLTAVNRIHEFGVHVRGAVTNGCSRDQIREALLQTAVYCGAPAALESFRVAERVLAEMGVDD